MKPVKKHISLVSFILILILSLIILSQVYGIFLKGTGHIRPAFLYILITLTVMVSFANMLLSYLLPEAENETGNNVQENTEHISSTVTGPAETNEQKADKETEKKIQQPTGGAEIKNIVQRVVPPKQAKLEEFGEKLFINLSKEFELLQGILDVKNLSENTFSSVSFYAYFANERPDSFSIGETLPGQVAKSNEIMQVDNVPEDYIQVMSGLGEGKPRNLIFIPVIKEDETIGIIELATFFKFDDNQLEMFKSLANNISNTLYGFIKGTEKAKNDKE